MNRILWFLVLAVPLMMASAQNLFAQELSWEEVSKGIFDVCCISIDPDNPRHILAGSSGSIFRSQDSGKNWERVLSIRGRNKAVNQIFFTKEKNKTIYAATDIGLYVSFNAGESWKRIFRGKNSSENKCNAVAANEQLILLGTDTGLFTSKDSGRGWEKESNGISQKAILSIDFASKPQSCIYAAGIEGVYRKDDPREAWEKIYVQHAPEKIQNEPDEAADSGQFNYDSDVRYIKVDAGDNNALYLATAKGVYRSLSSGENWEALPEYGLLHRDVGYLFLGESSELYAVNAAGIYLFSNGRWFEQTYGLNAGKIKSAAALNKNEIFVAGEKGIFKSISNVYQDFSVKSAAKYAQNEPQIRQVQQAAIEYAEVSPEKIKRWRKQAAQRGFLPQLSVGIDRNSTDLWHWEGGSTTKTDDDTLRRGQDTVDWDVRVSWDLGQIIWNDDQTNIDVRSKLMVELRDDILDQVNKLYFERLRVKMDLDNLSIGDFKKRNEKTLKLEELTASLDALTGGYFSSQLRYSGGRIT